MSARIEGKTSDNGLATIAQKLIEDRLKPQLNWLKYAGLAVLGMIGFGFTERVIEDNTPLSIPGFSSKASPGLITPASVAGIAGPSEATLSFVVQSAGKSKDGGILFLNDRANYKEPGTKTICVSLKNCPSLALLQPQSLKGKSVTAMGRPDTYNGKEEVWVEREGALRVN